MWKIIPTGTHVLLYPGSWLLANFLAFLLMSAQALQRFIHFTAKGARVLPILCIIGDRRSTRVIATACLWRLRLLACLNDLPQPHWKEFEVDVPSARSCKISPDDAGTLHTRLWLYL
ncbi:hypothetical protein Zmor_006015 [Zophobas morio]|uniref:Uncharacterized protein n=1 Tax=Zophobas morio TaxID=2755281 RepID=A0AA38MN81_9CUCU|nr:hypothetical protein Zmor_006015 [Zophobas morio]